MDTLHTRPLAGVLAMVAVVLAADLLLPDLGDSAAWSVAQSVLVLFLAAAAGAWRARGRFVVPALLVWAVAWLGMSWLLYRIGANAPPFGAILAYNAWAIVLSGAAAAFGAWAAPQVAQAPAATA